MTNRLLIALALCFALPSFALAQGFDADVSYGMSGNSVLEMQEFLGAHNFFSGPYTGNFYSLTLAAVKRFQKDRGISPVSGYFGPKSRAAALVILANEQPQSEDSVTLSPVQQSVPHAIIPAYVPTPSAPVPYTRSMETPAETHAAAAEPFARTGVVTASLSNSPETIGLSGVHVRVLQISIENGTNEPIQFTGTDFRNIRTSHKDETLENWTPTFTAYSKNRDLATGDVSIAPGGSSVVSFYVERGPDEVGAFTLAVDEYKMIGVTSGDIIAVAGFPISSNSIQAQ